MKRIFLTVLFVFLCANCFAGPMSDPSKWEDNGTTISPKGGKTLVVGTPSSCPSGNCIEGDLSVDGSVTITTTKQRAATGDISQVIFNTDLGYDTFLIIMDASTGLPTTYVDRGAGLIADPTPFNSGD